VRSFHEAIAAQLTKLASRFAVETLPLVVQRRSQA